MLEAVEVEGRHRLLARVGEAALGVGPGDGRLPAGEVEGGLAVARAGALAFVAAARSSSAPGADTASDTFPLRAERGQECQRRG